MASAHEDIWADGWRSRLELAIRAKGYESVTSLLAAHPAVPLTNLTERTELLAAPIQIVALALGESNTPDRWQRLVADLLCRHIADTCRKGWRSEPQYRWSQTLALSSWISDVLSGGNNIGKEDVLSNIAKAIMDDDLIKDNWVPSSPSDEVISKHLAQLIPLKAD